MYRVAYDRSRNVLAIHVSGFLTPDDVPALSGTIIAEARAATETRNDFNVIVESLDFPVQANDVADLLAEIMREGIALTTGRAAVVVGSQLNKLQAERTLAHPQLRVFRAMDEAERWLAADAAQPAAG